MIRRPPRSKLLPYTTLCRSEQPSLGLAEHGLALHAGARPDRRGDRRGVGLAAPARERAEPVRVGGDEPGAAVEPQRSAEHTSELQSRQSLVCRLLLEKKISREDRTSSLMVGNSSLIWRVPESPSISRISTSIRPRSGLKLPLFYIAPLPDDSSQTTSM